MRHLPLVQLALAAGLVAALSTSARAEEGEVPLEYLRIDKVGSYLDGGSVAIEGRVGGDAVAIRHDMRIGSETRGRFFMRRAPQGQLAEAPEVELDAAGLRELGVAIRRDVSGRQGLENVGRAIDERMIEEGLEVRRPVPRLRSFRVVDTNTEGYRRGDVAVRGLTRFGDQQLFLFDGKVLIKPRSFEFYQNKARPLLPKERTELLHALNRAAIDRLPNRAMRNHARKVRKAIAAEHAADRPARTRPARRR